MRTRCGFSRRFRAIEGDCILLTNYISTIIFIILSFITGYAVLLFMGVNKKEYKCIPCLCAPAGLAVNGVLAAFVYFRLGLNSGAVKISWIILAVFSLIFAVVKNHKDLKSTAGYFKALAFCLAFFVIMTVPGMYRGANYYVYKGNVYDKFAYISETVYMTNHNLDYGEKEMPEEEYYPDSLDLGYYYIVNDRPLVSLIPAGIAYKGDVFALGYLYVSMIWSFIAGPMMAMCEFLFPKRSRWKYLVFSVIYVFSVYCQIQNDMDTWSQQCACSILITFTFLWMLYLKDIIYGNIGLDIKQILGLGMIGTGAFMIYAEATWVYGLILVVLSFILFFVTGQRNRYREILKALAIPVLMLALCYIAHPGTFICAFEHILFATMDSNQKWANFYNYWQGYHEFIAATETGALIKKAFTTLPAWSGMYMITPVYSGIPAVLIAAWLGGLGLISAGILALIICAVIYVIKNMKAETAYEKTAVRISALGAICFFAVWISSGQKFTAAKSLMFISPLIYLLLSLPLMEIVMGSSSEESKTGAADSGIMKSRARSVMEEGLLHTAIRYGVLTVSVIFIICQISALGLRIGHILSDGDGVMAMGYYYPQMESSTKQEYTLDFDAGKYVGSDPVALVGGNAYLQLYAKLCLTYRGIDYYANPDWGAFKYKYSEGIPPREGDTVIYLEEECAKERQGD